MCMPEMAPYVKVRAVQALGGMVELVGESFQEAQEHAQVRELSWPACPRPVAQTLACQ